MTCPSLMKSCDRFVWGLDWDLNHYSLLVIFPPPKAFNSSERVWTVPEEWFIDWKKKRMIQWSDHSDSCINSSLEGDVH